MDEDEGYTKFCKDIMDKLRRRTKHLRIISWNGFLIVVEMFCKQIQLKVILGILLFFYFL